MESDSIARRIAARLAEGTTQPVGDVIVEDVWLAVVEGRLESGQRLPTARQLAITLGVSPRTVERAYAALERRGVTAARPGEGTFVRLDPPAPEELERHRAFAALCREVASRTHALGFGVDDLMDALAELRDQRKETP